MANWAKPIWHVVACMVAFTQTDVPDWWERATFGKKAVTTMIGAISLAGVIFFAGIGVAQTFTEFRELPGEVAQIDSTMERHLLLADERTLRERVLKLEDDASDFRAFHRWLGGAVGDLRCRALVTDGVYQTHSECWAALDPPRSISRPTLPPNGP